MQRGTPHEGTPLTVEAYCALPDDERYRDELVRGRLVREPRPGPQHAWLQVRLGSMLHDFVERQGLGFVLGDAGYVLAEKPATVRGPDLSFVAAGRMPDGPSAELPRLAPDLAVEIVSPSNRPAEIHEKVMQYLEAGVRLVWIVDPRARTIAVHRPGTAARVLALDDPLNGEDVLPGFTVPVRRVFDA
jgi:Uma2 family endonuclease